MTGITIRKACKTHGNRAVLRGIDLAVPDGALVALLGPSGCGKTTLLRLIAGFDRLDGGTIDFGTRTVAAPHVHVPPERRNIGYVPQEGALFPHLTVKGNVGYGLPRRERAGARVGSVLALTGLADLGDRLPHQLSGGQQQRAALARALAPGPALVLLDEPFNALDLDLRRNVCEDVVAMLRRAGTTTVLVTHDPVEAFASADLVAVMQGGQIMQVGTPHAVYWTPMNATVARLTGAAIFVDGTFCGNQVLTPFGSLPLHPAFVRDAGAASVMLRPEQIVPSGKVGTPARIVGRLFRGDHTVLTMMLGDQEIRLGIASSCASAIGADALLRVEGPCVAFQAQPQQSHHPGSPDVGTEDDRGRKVRNLSLAGSTVP